jgi:hypothetical protein
MQDAARTRSSENARQSLPSPDRLLELLNELGAAQDANDDVLVERLEEEIIGLVELGAYEGYVGEDLEISYVQVISVERGRPGANIYSFQITLKIDFSPSDPDTKERTMDLMEFLRPINRALPTGGQQIGPRFITLD